MISTITSKGQITLPSEIRKALKIKSGDKLDFTLTSDGELRARRIESGLESIASILPKPASTLSVAEMDHVIRNSPKAK